MSLINKKIEYIMSKMATDAAIDTAVPVEATAVVPVSNDPTNKTTIITTDTNYNVTTDETKKTTLILSKDEDNNFKVEYI